MFARSLTVLAAVVAFVSLTVPHAEAAQTYSAHWALDEIGSSTAYDATGNGNDGTNENVVGDGGGYTFDGVDSRVVVPSSASLNSGSGDFSYGVTLTMTQAPATGETYEVLSKGLAGDKAGNYKIEITSSSGKAKARCVFNSILPNGKRSNSAQLAGTSLADGRAHTISCTKNSTSISIQIDALPATTKAIAAGLGSVSNTAALGLGAKAQPDTSSGYDWFKGVISDAWVSSVPDATPPPPPPPTDPTSPAYKAHWTLDEIGSSTAHDVTGNGNDGTNYDVVGNGTGYTFNGVDSRVIVPDSASLNPGSADFFYGITLTMTQPPATGETYDVLRKGLVTNKAGDYKIEIVNSSGKAKARCVFNSFRSNGTKVLAAVMKSVQLANGVPHTVTCSKTSTTITIQVDSLPVHTKAIAGGLGSISNTSNLGLGAKSEDDPKSGYDWFNGVISDAWVAW